MNRTNESVVPIMRKQVLDIDAICPLYNPSNRSNRNVGGKDDSEKSLFDAAFPLSRTRGGRPFLATNGNPAPSGLQKSILVRLKKLEEVRRRNADLIATQRKEIQTLRDIVATTKSDSARAEMTAEMREEIECLKKENEEMRDFLISQGIRWVGNRSNSTRGKGVECSEYEPLEEEGRPSETQAKSGKDAVDINKFVQGVEQLNIVVDRLKVKSNGGYHRVPTVPLTIFADGIFLYRGPFRSFASSRQFVDEVSNGYVPSEFKSKYPEGVQFQVRSIDCF